jgi:hypothetical protein
MNGFDFFLRGILAWVITSTKADRDARLAFQKRRFTVRRACDVEESPAVKESPSGLSHIMQCPQESFWKEWAGKHKRPDS